MGLGVSFPRVSGMKGGNSEFYSHPTRPDPTGTSKLVIDVEMEIGLVLMFFG